MNVRRNIIINLSEDDVKEMIANQLKQEGYDVKAYNVNLDYKTRTVGMGYGEHRETEMLCRVKCIDKEQDTKDTEEANNESN